MKRRISIAFNFIIALAAPAAWLFMVFSLPEGPLSSQGVGSLKYFTVLSNMFACAVSVKYLIVTRLESREPPKRVAALKHMAASAIGLTFFTVLLFLGPVYGYAEYKLYDGGSLWLHLIVPLLAMADYIFFDNCPVPPFKATFLGLVPAVVYSVFYCSNLLINGVEGNDFYGFVIGGAVGAVIMGIIMLSACWLISFMLWRLKKTVYFSAQT